MATEDPQPPSGSESVVTERGDDDFSLEPGTEVQGRLVSYRRVETNYNSDTALLTIDSEEHGPVDILARGEAKQAFNDNNLEKGATYWIAMMNNEQELNGTTYNPVKCRRVD